VQSSQSLLLPPLEERDLATVHDALLDSSAASGLSGYKHTRGSEYMLEVVTGVLARHELYVARFYLAEGNFKAAVARCQYALRHYDASGLEAEAMVLLGETYMKLKKRKAARAVFRQMLTLYPDSPFSLPARRFLKLLGDPAAG
jgi:outer membrane protein assembly factor BamD